MRRREGGWEGGWEEGGGEGRRGTTLYGKSNLVPRPHPLMRKMVW